MSVTSRENGLSADERSTIRNAILSSREMLESEFERQLERYGVYEEKRVPMSELGHLSLQDRETRREIDAGLERELEAAEEYERAYKNYVRQATKEYLNRYVGLKTIEARRLVTEALTTEAEYGNRSYLHYTVDEIAGELTDTPDDGLGVALDLAFQEIGAEIRILFEDTDYTAIEPEFTVRRDIFEELDKLDNEAWAADEAIGWVYQYFGEKEREEIDERIDEENYKVQDTDVATKTQLFTPRYIVEWMVDNSLGRLWLEMYGDETNIDDENACFYLAPLEESMIDRDVKDVQDITVLDPACGSGHMLFYAFDVLYGMYLEQGTVPEKHIPREILKHNLYGIDIDPGAVQIAALALYTKAKKRAPDEEIEQINVISADAVLVNGEKKQDVLNRVDTELEKRVLNQVWQSFENIREWGSLVRIEEHIEEIVEEELERIESTGQTEFTGDGRLAKQASVVSFRGDSEESWENVKTGILTRVTELAEEALERNDPIEEMFVGEVEKSVELLDYFLGNYDVVVTNPPYLGSSKMGDDLKQYIKDNYLGTRDAFAAFIQRCWEFAGPDNYAALVTPESYMFQYSYRKLRKRLIAEQQFIEGAHLSGYSFSMKDRPFTIPFVLRNRDPADFHSSRFYRLTHEQVEYSTYEDKIRGLRDITASNREECGHNDVYTVNQNTFAEIERTPLIYWFGTEILNLFIKEGMQRVPEPKKGLSTGDDPRFLRNWWEVPKDEIGERYKWFMTSGSGDPYYTSSEKLVLWENDGREIKEASGSHTRGESLYEEFGLTCRKFGKIFTARIHPSDHIFAESAYFIPDSEQYGAHHLTGYLCSSFVRYILGSLNPAMHFNTSAIKSVPFPEEIQNEPEISALVNRAVNLQKKRFSLRETKKDFPRRDTEVSEELIDYLYHEEVLEGEIEVIHGLIDNLVFENIGVSDELQTRIYSEFTDNLADYPLLERTETTSGVIQESVKTKSISEEEYSSIVDSIERMEGDSITDISQELGISPISVATIRFEHDIYDIDEKRDAAGRLISYFLGCAFGRWDTIEQIEPSTDGIIVFDDTLEGNITDRIHECIEATFGNVYDMEGDLEEILNRSVTDWLREKFFSYQCKHYRRRNQRTPIYWQLESNQSAFSCFLYYHAMDADTLSKLRGQYVDAKIRTLENRLGGLERDLESAGGEGTRELRNKIETVQEQLDDIEDFGERLDALIDDGFEPEFEAGIWENIQKVDEYDLLQTELDKL